MNRRAFIGATAVAALSAALAACGNDSSGEGGGGGGGKVGVAMPTQTLERWIHDGDNVKTQLTEAGYEVDLQYANDDIPTQQQQIDQMIVSGCKVLIIAAIDGTALATQLDAAKEAGIKVIAYDRLLRDSDGVDFYISFDNYKVGQAQGQSLLDGLAEKFADQKPANIELFAGAPDDNNATFFFNGAMSKLQPKIDDGTLVVKSNQLEFDQVATLNWQQELAQRRMEDILTSTYSSGEKVHGVYCSNDALARGVLTALQNAGYGGETLPITTGQDAEIASAKLINDGVQYSSIFKDTRNLAEEAANSAKTLLAGEVPEPNNTEDYDNGVKVVPAKLLDVTTVTRDNVKEVLVDSGYYTQEQLDAGVI